MPAIVTQQIVNSAPGNVPANNMTGTAIVLSSWIDLALIGELALEIQITGTPTGTLTIEGTNQPNPSHPQDPNPSATAVPFAAGAMVPALPAVAGAAVAYLGGLVILGNQGSARWVRLRYVNSAGSGRLDVYANGSGL